MARGYTGDLPVAYEYSPYELPDSIREKYLRGEVEYWKEFDEETKWKRKEEEEWKEESEEIGTEMKERIANERLIPLLERYIYLHKGIMQMEEEEEGESTEGTAEENNTNIHYHPNIRKRFVLLREWDLAGLGNRLQVILFYSIL